MEGTIGEIRIFAGNFRPRGWDFCHGQLVPIDQNTALFSILGTIYGGDGRTTFGLPDLRNRTVVGAGTNTLGSNNSSFEVEDNGQLMVSKELSLNYIICTSGIFPSRA